MHLNGLRARPFRRNDKDLTPATRSVWTCHASKKPDRARLWPQADAYQYQRGRNACGGGGLRPCRFGAHGGDGGAHVRCRWTYYAPGGAWHDRGCTRRGRGRGARPAVLAWAPPRSRLAELDRRSREDRPGRSPSLRARTRVLRCGMCLTGSSERRRLAWLLTTTTGCAPRRRPKRSIGWCLSTARSRSISALAPGCSPARFRAASRTCLPSSPTSACGPCCRRAHPACAPRLLVDVARSRRTDALVKGLVVRWFGPLCPCGMRNGVNFAPAGTFRHVEL